MKTITLSGIEYELTSEKTRRIVQAIVDTERIISNMSDESKSHTMTFSERKPIIEQYQKHVEFLKGLLA